MELIECFNERYRGAVKQAVADSGLEQQHTDTVSDYVSEKSRVEIEGVGERELEAQQEAEQFKYGRIT